MLFLLAMLMAATDVMAQTFKIGALTYTVETENGETYAQVMSSDDSVSVTVPDEVTNGGNTYPVKKVAAMAFAGKSKLETVVIGNNISEISYATFSYSKSLTHVTLPDGITRIGNDAFKSCEALLSVNVPSSLQSVGDNAFYRCLVLQEFILPEGVQNIGKSAFFYCQRITKAVIPSTVTSLGRYAFGYCPELLTVEVKEGVKSIGESVFHECTKLETVALPSSLDSIGNSAFYKCKKLYSITLPDGLQHIGMWAFGNCSSLREITIPSSVTSMGNNVFDRCGSLNTLHFNASMSNIPQGMCTYCTGLSTFDKADNVTRIDNYAFTYCGSLHAFDFTNIDSIGYAAFNKSGLMEAILPDGVKTVGDFAFVYCRNLKKVRIGASTKLGKLDFVATYKLKELELGADNPYYTLLDDVLFSKDMKTLEVYPSARDVNVGKFRYQVPASVTTIAPGAMNGIIVTAVVLPRGLKTIGDCAFLGAHIDWLTIPESVDSIGACAFNDCDQDVKISHLVFLRDTPVTFRNNGGYGYNGGTNISSNISFYRSDTHLHTYVKESALSAYQQAAHSSYQQIHTTFNASFGLDKELQSAGYDFDIDLTGQEVMAYTASSYDEGEDVMIMQPTDVSDYASGKYIAQQAGTMNIGGVDYDRFTGVILKGTAGQSYSFKIGEGKNKTLNNATNHLIGMPAYFYVEPTETIDGTTYTTYGLKDGKFRKYTRAGVLPLHKAFMALPESWHVSAKTNFFFEEAGSTTDIHSLRSTDATTDNPNAPYYNLNGQRVEHPQHGIYIHKGKKVIIK